MKAVFEYAQTHDTTDIIYGGWDFIDANGHFTRRMYPVPFDWHILMQCGCYIGSTACFYKRATTIGEGHLLNVDFHYCMDGEYYVRLASLGKKFIHIPKILADFRLHGESISQKNLNKADIASVLKMQRQSAEPRAIRRIYGIKLFRDENLNLIVDGILYHIFRLKKGILRALYKPSNH